MTNVPELYGERVFNDEAMKKYLPKGTYKDLKQTIEDGKPLDLSIANVVAHAMKEWAIEHGATHYTHWFQPMTGITAEKHEPSAHIQAKRLTKRLLFFALWSVSINRLCVF